MDQFLGSIPAYVYFIREAKARDSNTTDLKVTAALQTFNMREGEVREDIASVLAYSVVSYNGFSQDDKPIETHTDFRSVDLRDVTHGVVDDVLLVEPWDYFQDRLP